MSETLTLERFIVWEENDLIGISKNCESNQIIDQNGTINETKTASVKKECEDIGKENIIIGIYKIINKVNGKYYVGSSENILERWKQHKRDLKRGKHHSDHLQRAWNKYGENSFDFVIVEKVEDKNTIREIEQKYLNECKESPDITYNVSYDASSPMKGRKTTEKTKVLLSKASKKYWLSEEEREKQSLRLKGKKFSEEWKRKISESLKGRTFSEEHKRKICESKKNISDETRKKMSLSIKIGMKKDEVRKKISDAKKKRKGLFHHSEETKKKLSDLAKLKDFKNHFYKKSNENN